MTETNSATAPLSKFRRKWLERLEGTRVFIADGRESARLESLEAARQSELELEKEIHARRNEEQLRIANEDAARKAAQGQTKPPETPPGG